MRSGGAACRLPCARGIDFTIEPVAGSTVVSPIADALYAQQQTRFQIFAMVLCQCQLSAIAQHDAVIAAKPRLQLADAIQIHDRRAVNAEKLRRIQTGFEFIHRFAHYVGLAATVQADVIVGGFDPIDVRKLDKNHAAIIADGDTSGG